MKPLLGQIGCPIERFTADGAYDGKPTYDAISNHSADAVIVIPPRANAVEPACDRPPGQRNQHSGAISKDGRMKWQATTGYGKRALVETAIGRYETLIGRRVQARSFHPQHGSRHRVRRPQPDVRMLTPEIRSPQLHQRISNGIKDRNPTDT